MEQFKKTSFAAALAGAQKSFDLYSLGEGPPVIVIQELPGIGVETIALAEKLAKAGFSVTLPHLFGPLGRTDMTGNLFRVFCMRREFQLFAAGKSSAIVLWLAALCRDVKARSGAKGVGVIGMCLTGNFAISLTADDSVLAAVASQPSMPVANQTALHMSPAEIARARAKLEAVGPMLAYRFEGDKICTATKFEAIDKAFNDGRERIALKTLPGEGHSVLTRHFVDEAGSPTRAALDEVLAYFSKRLK